MGLISISGQTQVEKGGCSAYRAKGPAGGTFCLWGSSLKACFLVMLIRLVQGGLLTALCCSVTSKAEASNPVQHSSTLYTQVVESADPGLHWTAPSSINYGTALSAIQLSATANVAGDFLYSPALGDVLPPGTQMLSVTFIPKNPNFNTAVATVPLVVVAPAGMSFSLTTTLPPTQQPATTVMPGTDAFVHLTLTPSGSFREKVTLTCSAPVNLRCSLDPVIISPGETSVPIVLQISYVPPAQHLGPEPPLRPASFAAPGRIESTLVLGMLALLGFKRHKGLARIRRSFTVMSALIATMALLLTMGCGFGPVGTIERVTVIAASQTTTRSLQVAVDVLNIQSQK